MDKTLRQDGIFDFPGQSSAPLLLIMDRRDDPVTPLLTQWTYQVRTHALKMYDVNPIFTLQVDPVWIKSVYLCLVYLLAV